MNTLPIDIDALTAHLEDIACDLDDAISQKKQNRLDAIIKARQKVLKLKSVISKSFSNQLTIDLE